jgi:hypothetical protein
VGGIKSTELTYENGKVEAYSLIRGSIVWPYETYPGVILLGAQKLGSDILDILREELFNDISSAVEIFRELWSYQPSVYYYPDGPESEGFLSFLRRSSELTGKLPLIPAAHIKAVEYGNQLIGTFLDAGRLTVPPRSVLATQLKEGRLDTAQEELYSVIALRHLIIGIEAYPYEEEIEDFDLSRCLV